MGATTGGEVFADKEMGINEVDGTILVMLLDINPSAISFKFSSLSPEDSYYKAGRNVALWAKNNFKNAAIITTKHLGLSFGLNWIGHYYFQRVIN